MTANTLTMSNFHPSSVSRSLFPIMTDRELRSGWDLAKLIVGLSCSTPSANRHTGRAGYPCDCTTGFANGDSNSRPMASMLAWLSTRVKIDRLKANQDCPEKPGSSRGPFDVRSELIRNGGRTHMDDLRKAFSHHPRGLFDCYDTPWMRHWRDPKEFKIPANTSGLASASFRKAHFASRPQSSWPDPPRSNSPSTGTPGDSRLACAYRR